MITHVNYSFYSLGILLSVSGLEGNASVVSQ